MRFDFPSGQQIGPGDYLIVSRDDEAMRTKFPEIAGQIIGEYDGSLSNQNERIVLRDTNGNPADVVEYFQDGQWPRAADGRGSSLELRDPTADNSRGLAWAASEESHRSTWTTYSYQGETERSTIGNDAQWNELVIGLLVRRRDLAG